MLHFIFDSDGDTDPDADACGRGRRAGCSSSRTESDGYAAKGGLLVFECGGDSLIGFGKALEWRRGRRRPVQKVLFKLES